jgi:hypothetical protein
MFTGAPGDVDFLAWKVAEDGRVVVDDKVADCEELFSVEAFSSLLRLRLHPKKSAGGMAGQFWIIDLHLKS